MPKLGAQTWEFRSEPRIVGSGTVAGNLEGSGPLGDYFDVRLPDDRGNADTWEHFEQSLWADAADRAVKKAGLTFHQLDLAIGADLNAQLTGFYFGLRDFNLPSLGVYSACSSFTEGFAIGAMSIDAGFADHVLVGTSSHTSTAERQFRYPTEYGAQKPPTAQRTVTGAGVGVLSKAGSQIALTHATIGRIVDYGITSPWEYGAAMAPAAESTIAAHLSDTGRTLSDYDCVSTGDLGRVGHKILRELLENRGLRIETELTDCGVLIYREDQPEVFSGGSGTACSALVTLSYFLHKLQSGEWKRILICATGALLSTVTAQQSDTIPSISHAIVLERKDGSA